MPRYCFDPASNESLGLYNLPVLNLLQVPLLERPIAMGNGGSRLLYDVVAFGASVLK